MALCIFYFSIKRFSVSFQCSVRFFNPTVAYCDLFSQACAIKLLWRFFLSCLQGWLERSEKEGEVETKGSKQEMKHKSGLEKDGLRRRTIASMTRNEGMTCWSSWMNDWGEQGEMAQGEMGTIIERSRPKMVLLQSRLTFNFLSFPLASLPVF